MNPITIITAVPNIHTDPYKKRWRLGVGIMLSRSGVRLLPNIKLIDTTECITKVPVSVSYMK